MSITQILKQKCPSCGKIAREKTRIHIKLVTVVVLECNHTIISTEAEIDKSAIFTSLDNKTPYPFQIENADFVEKAGYRALIADEPGLGKTISALLTLHRNKADLLPALFLVKSTLRAQFVQEIIRWLGPEYVPQTINSSADKAYPGFQTYVCSLDLLSRLNGTFDNIDIKTVIVDECQLIKNSEAKRTQEVRKLCANVKNVIFLSGTPIKNKPEEYFTVLNICRPTIFPSLAGYINKWLYTDYSGGYVKTMGLRQPERFKEITSEFIIRHTKKEVLPDLEKIERRMFYSNLDEKEKEKYDKVVDEFVDYMEESENKSNSLEYYTCILAYFSKMRHLSGLSKVASCVEFVTQFLLETDRKITIFAHHIDVAEILFDRLSEWCKDGAMTEPIRLSADMDIEERTRAIETFRDKSRILIASTLSSGEGLNLQFCSDAIMLERQWNPANEEQAECRFERIGQQADAIFITYMIALGTIDEYFTELVEVKRAMITEAMDGVAIPWKESDLMKDLSNIIQTKRNGEKWKRNI